MDHINEEEEEENDEKKDLEEHMKKEQTPEEVKNWIEQTFAAQEGGG